MSKILRHPYFGGIHILEASGIFPVGACDDVVVVLSTMKVQSRTLPCCTLARKANHRLVLCLLVLLLCLAIESTSNGGQLCVRDK